MLRGTAAGTNNGFGAILTTSQLDPHPVKLTSCAMYLSKVFGGLHFGQARCGAFERADQAFSGIQVHWHGIGGADQVDVAVVQLVDQVHEAACGAISM